MSRHRGIELFKVTASRRMVDLPPPGLRDQMVDVHIINALACTCGGIHPRRVEPASPRHGDVSGSEVSSPGVEAFIGFAAQAKPALTALERPLFTPSI